MGPRGPSSSSLPSAAAAPTPPLVIRKQQRPTLPSLAPPGPSPARSPSPSLSLSIPGASSRSTTPKPKLPKISLAINGHSAEGGYYGGPTGTAVALQTPDTQVEELTIRPDSSSLPPAKEPNIQDVISNIQNRPPSSRSAPSSDPEEDAVPLGNSPNLTWGDDVLEEVSRLGEGAGGAVHKVKDKRTGKLMARKTITTREAPMKQLLRELSIISSTEHINIILFYGAYMSPSSSEVKIVMEFCEGGSLEAVGKRIKERNAIVGEKIAGRLAEGVRPLAHFNSVLYN